MSGFDEPNVVFDPAKMNGLPIVVVFNKFGVHQVPLGALLLVKLKPANLGEDFYTPAIEFSGSRRLLWLGFASGNGILEI